MHNFLCENVSIFPLYIFLTRRINRFCLTISTNFGLEISALFGHKNHTRKMVNILKDFIIPSVDA